MSTLLILLFPIGAIVLSALAYVFPEWFTGLRNAIVPLLGIVMFSMGMSLQFNDFKNVFLKPRVIGIGLVMQYLLMPFIAWVLVQILELPLGLATGLILVGSCPGGTASNVICYLARGDVALSITLTSVSTLVAVFLTPLMTLLYVDQSIDVPVIEMIKKLFLIIILPVVSGVLINTFFRSYLDDVKRVLPIISMLSVILIISIIVAISHAQLAQVGMLVGIAVVLHNLLGFASGYGIAKLLHFDKSTTRTLAIEVGMQNSGLAIVLANQYFSALAALPGALFSVWHNISGALLASLWSGADLRLQEKEKQT